MTESKVFVSDSGAEPKRIHATISVTPELCAHEQAFNAFIGQELRELLLAGKTVVIQLVSG